MLTHNKVFIRFILSCLIGIGLATKINICQAMEVSPFSEIHDQEQLNLEIGKRAGTIYRAINSEKKWRYSTCESGDITDYLKYLFTSSDLWEVPKPDPNSPCLTLVKKEGVPGSQAFTDLLTSEAIIDCEQTLSSCLSKVLCDVIGPYYFDIFIANRERIRPVTVYEIKHLESSIPEIYRMSKTIGHFGYIKHATLHEALEEKLGIPKPNYGYHCIIVGKDENDQALHATFSTDLPCPCTSQEIISDLRKELYETFGILANRHANLFKEINTHYKAFNLSLQSNEDIISSSHLSALIDEDYKLVNDKQFSLYLDLPSIQKIKSGTHYTS